jgi:4-oxalocrotonate tautomerase
MPHVEIAVRQGRPETQIRSMISAVTRAVSESLAAPMESIRVLVVEVPATHWANGDVTLAEKHSAAPQSNGDSSR